MEELSDFPNYHFSTGIPFLKPMLYGFTIAILGTPTFCIEDIFCKNIINAPIFLIKPHIKPQSDRFFSFIHNRNTSLIYFHFIGSIIENPEPLPSSEITLI